MWWWTAGLVRSLMCKGFWVGIWFGVWWSNGQWVGVPLDFLIEVRVVAFLSSTYIVELSGPPFVSRCADFDIHRNDARVICPLFFILSLSVCPISSSFVFLWRCPSVNWLGRACRLGSVNSSLFQFERMVSACRCTGWRNSSNGLCCDLGFRDSGQLVFAYLYTPLQRMVLVSSATHMPDPPLL